MIGFKSDLTLPSPDRRGRFLTRGLRPFYPMFRIGKELNGAAIIAGTYVPVERQYPEINE